MGMGVNPPPSFRDHTLPDLVVITVTFGECQILTWNVTYFGGGGPVVISHSFHYLSHRFYFLYVDHPRASLFPKYVFLH